MTDTATTAPNEQTNTAPEPIDDHLLKEIANMVKGHTHGAINIRKNGELLVRHQSENVTISTKADVPGIDIVVKPGTRGERVHIPVIITETDTIDLVYNDFHIGEGADVYIVAGCGIHNDGDGVTQHDGIHRFYLGPNSHVTYVEKHYAEGDGSGERVLNPQTEVYLEEGAICEMDMVQIRGVDSTMRLSTAELKKNSKLIMTEKLLTHGKQFARSDMKFEMIEEGATVQVISRSVAQDDSEQIFNPLVIGSAPCKGHVQCDAIIMGNARVSAIPGIEARDEDAQLIHEAAIGKIAGEQIVKLMTLGLSEEEAENCILDDFLS